jgi:hypothetical protein
MSLDTRSVKTGGGTSLTDGQNAVAADVDTDMVTVFNRLNGQIGNDQIVTAAGIAYAKLNLATSIVNADVSASAAIAYSKLNLATSILNADVSASAAIAYSKLALSASIVTADIATTGIAVSKLDAPFVLDSGIVNGFFDWWQRSPTATGVAVSVGADAYIADRWAVEPAGAGCTVSRVTTGLHSGSVGDVGIELLGAASVTSIELTQRIPRATARRLGALLANQNVTFGAKIIHSGTTGTITPTLIVRSTSNTGDDTTATKFADANMTARVTNAFTGITTTQESSLSHTFDLGAMTDSQNGVELVLSFATMGATTQRIIVSDIYLIRGAVAPLTLIRPHEDDELMKCFRYYRKTFDYATAPAQATGSYAGAFGTASDNFTSMALWNFGAFMRGVPTLTTYNPTQANANARSAEDAVDATVGSSSTADSGVSVTLSTAGQERSWAIHAQADAEWYD